MNEKILVFVFGVEAIVYLLLYNLHDCTFNSFLCVLSSCLLKNKLRITIIEKAEYTYYQYIKVMQ